MIDWQEITDAWNKMEGKNFTTKQMLEHLYDRFQSLQKMADFLGVSCMTIPQKMDKLNIPRKRTNWKRPFLVDRMKAIPADKMAEMTAAELAHKLGCRQETVWCYAKKLNRKYKKRWIRYGKVAQLDQTKTR